MPLKQPITGTKLSLCKTYITQHGFDSLPDEIKIIVKCKVERYVKSEEGEDPKLCGAQFS